MVEQKQTQSEKKRQAIKQAAIKQFVEQGFEGAKMDEIAEHAGVSKQTIYSHFGSKENLFSSILSEMCDGYAELFEENINAHADDPKEALRSTMHHIIPEVMAPERLALTRLVYSEVPRCPELGKFYLEIVQDYMNDMTAYMEDLNKRGFIKTNTPELAAKDFIGLVKGFLVMECLCSCEPLYTDEEICKKVDHAIETFFKAYSPKHG